jgi:hypothetical protein
LDGALVRLASVLIALSLLVATPVPTPAVKVTAKHGSAREMETKDLLERILREYDLTKYMFTREVSIEDQRLITPSRC